MSAFPQNSSIVLVHVAWADGSCWNNVKGSAGARTANEGGSLFPERILRTPLFSSNSSFLPKRAIADLLVLHISKWTSPDA